MSIRQNRRTFLRQTALGVAGFWVAGCRPARRRLSPNEQLNLGIIGVAHQGNYDLTAMTSENVVALCDVDEHYLAAAKEKFPAAQTYTDFRRLLDQRDIDAVVIATPDHTHAVAAVAALRSGRHVYCEKPLTRTVSECRAVTNVARQQKLITQIGTQIHSGENYRRVAQLVQEGAVGTVSEVHVWVNASAAGKAWPTESPPVPAHLHYDLWLGPVPARPYSPEIVPRWWRNWWAFGGGALADFGCHYMDLPHWALGLRAPTRVQVVDGPPVHPNAAPPWLVVQYEYPGVPTATATRTTSPLSLTWYHGGRKPTWLPATIAQQWSSGVLFIGQTGRLLADYTRQVILREPDFADYTAPQPVESDYTAHHREWIQAVKNNRPASCDFAYSGPLTEAALLGNVAFRAGSPLQWDSARLRAPNCPAADLFLQHEYRRGWSL